MPAGRETRPPRRTTPCTTRSDSSVSGRLLPLLLSIAPQVAGQELAAGNGPNDYVNYGCRESGGAVAPRLFIEREDGTRESLPAVADALLIGYLPEGQFGGLRFLAVNLCGSNRATAPLRTGARTGPKGRDRAQGDTPRPHERIAVPACSAPFEIGAYEVRETWDEDRVSWDTRPRRRTSPSSTVRTRPDAAEVRLDVTGSARRLADPDAAARGWLIQVVHPMRWDAPEPGAGGRDRTRAPGPLPVGRVRPGGDPTRGAPRESSSSPVVRSHPQADKTSFFEQVLLAAALADPDVLALVSRHFVPVRINVHPAAYTMEADMQGASDPFAELGTSLKDEKATALVASDGQRRVASLTNIGTFDRDLVLRLLLGAVDPNRRPEARGSRGRMVAARHGPAGRRPAALRPNRGPRGGVRTRPRGIAAGRLRRGAQPRPAARQV